MDNSTVESETKILKVLKILLKLRRYALYRYMDIWYACRV
jgi:hypothetical protein